MILEDIKVIYSGDQIFTIESSPEQTDVYHVSIWTSFNYQNGQYLKGILCIVQNNFLVMLIHLVIVNIFQSTYQSKRDLNWRNC